MQTAFVTGAAGFIGSNLVDKLIEHGFCVIGWDNFSTGRREFLSDALRSSRFRLVEGDNLDLPELSKAMSGSGCVFHLAANADVRFGLEHPARDFEQNTLATFNVLEAMRSNRIRSLVFSSTGSVYGEAKIIPTPEDHPFPIQTSLYGASKLACEGLIQAYCEGFGIEAVIFRFVGILGPRYTHGHVIDFSRQLRRHPDRLQVLGDGNQRKSYLHVTDCVSAMLHAMEQKTAQKAPHRVALFNLGTDEYCTVQDSIRWITSELEVSPKLVFSGGERGWIGDNPFIYLDTRRIRQTGWHPTHSIKSSIQHTVRWLARNSWSLEEAAVTV